MEVSKVEGVGEVKWVLNGELDEDSILGFESLILNSQDLGSTITVDISQVKNMPNMGICSFNHIASLLESSGSTMNIIGASDVLSRKLRVSGNENGQ